MTTSSSRVESSRDSIRDIRTGLTVRLIMTSRKELMTCCPDDRIDSLEEAKVKGFSILPVVRNDRIVGIFNADLWFETTEIPKGLVGDNFESLSEDNFIGSDADIVDFIKMGVECPLRLVVSSNEVEGLVSMADLHKLPVRAALFSVITALEMAMTDRINEIWQNNSNGWLDLLSDGRRKKVNRLIAEAIHNDTYVSDIVYTQFVDKATIVRKRGLLSGSNAKLQRDFKTIRRLRDNLAHANEYATTKSAANEVSDTVKKILRFVDELYTSGAKETSSTDPSCLT